VLIYAVRPDYPQHDLCRVWLESTVNSPEPFGMSPQALASVIRILTNPRIFREPVLTEQAIHFCDGLLAAPNCRLIQPGMRHWDIFTGLCRKAKAKGNLVQDGWWAALAIESGCEWTTCDGDFARFHGLRWRSP
jgi:toxin-antitoxin system PIN domain toxin